MALTPLIGFCIQLNQKPFHFLALPFRRILAGQQHYVEWEAFIHVPRSSPHPSKVLANIGTTIRPDPQSNPSWPIVAISAEHKDDKEPR